MGFGWEVLEGREFLGHLLQASHLGFKVPHPLLAPVKFPEPGGQTRARLMLSLVKKKQSLILARMRDV